MSKYRVSYPVHAPSPTRRCPRGPHRLRAWMCWGLPPVRLPLGRSSGGLRLRGSHGQRGSRRLAAPPGVAAFFAIFLGFLAGSSVAPGFRTGFFLPGGGVPTLGFALTLEAPLEFVETPEAVCDFAPKQLAHRPTGSNEYSRLSPLDMYLRRGGWKVFPMAAGWLHRATYHRHSDSQNLLPP